MPPIRRLWISRGRTSVSTNHAKRPATASKSTVVIESSCFQFCVFFDFYQVYHAEQFGSRLIAIYRFAIFLFFSYARCRPSPGITPTYKITTSADTAPIIQNRNENDSAAETQSTSVPHGDFTPVYATATALLFSHLSLH